MSRTQDAAITSINSLMKSVKFFKGAAYKCCWRRRMVSGVIYKCWQRMGWGVICDFFVTQKKRRQDAAITEYELPQSGGEL